RLLSALFFQSPFDHFPPGWFFTVHKDPCAVYLPRKPYHKEEARYKTYHTKRQLPVRYGAWHAISHPRHHHNRGSKRNNAGPHGNRAGRVFHSDSQHSDSKNDNQGYRKRERLGFPYIFIYCTANSCVDRGIKEKSA